MAVQGGKSTEMKNVIITGANSGLGYETALKIAHDTNCRVILACRNETKANAAKEKIIEATGNTNVETMILDTSLLSSVRAFVSQYPEAYGTVDVLINNAGISPQKSGFTEEGYELVFATNYLGHFLLTQMLLPHFSETARIINVTSDMHDPPGGIEWKGVEYLAHPKADDRRRYSYSKLCNIYFTYKLAEVLKDKGSAVTVNAFNPGYMADTNFSGTPGNAERAMHIKLTMPERYGELGSSSQALAEIAVSEKYAGITNSYFDRSFGVKASSPLSYNKENRDELWKKSLEYCGL